MDTNSTTDSERLRIFDSLVQRDIQENLANSSLNSEILTKLSIIIERLPPKSQKILQECASKSKNVTFDPISISLQQSKETADKFQDEYEILKLQQMNAKLQAKIDRNNKFLEGLRRELDSSKHSLSQLKPNPENIHESIRQLKQKLVAYEQSCDKAKSNFSNLGVSDNILPKSLTSLVSSLAALREEAMTLKRDADDVLFLKRAVANIKKIR